MFFVIEERYLLMILNDGIYVDKASLQHFSFSIFGQSSFFPLLLFPLLRLLDVE